MEQKMMKKARVHGKDLEISTKQAMAICDFIRGRSPEHAMEMLGQVVLMKKAVPMKGQIAHKSNMPKGKPAGRYPINASMQFIKLLKSMVANANSKNLNTDALVISMAKADKAARPFKATRMAYGRKRFKRSHVIIEATETRPKEEKKKPETKQEEKKPEHKTEEKKIEEEKK